MSRPPILPPGCTSQPVFLRVIDQCLFLVDEQGKPIGAQVSVTASCAVDEMQEVVVRIMHNGWWQEPETA